MSKEELRRLEKRVEELKQEIYIATVEQKIKNLPALTPAKLLDSMDLAEEQADVEIMLEQLRVVLNDDELVESFREEKLTRLEGTLHPLKEFKEG
jgi:hypothetical protein